MLRNDINDAESVSIGDAPSKAESETRVDDVANMAVVAPACLPSTKFDTNAFE